APPAELRKYAEDLFPSRAAKPRSSAEKARPAQPRGLVLPRSAPVAARDRAVLPAPPHICSIAYALVEHLLYHHSILKLPNFFLAGAPKTGTTSLYSYLRQPPDIYLSPVKEPSYFASEVRPENVAQEYRAAVLKNNLVLRELLNCPAGAPMPDN